MASRQSSRCRGISFPQFQSVGERVGHPSLHKSYMCERFAASSNLYRTNLQGHFGCVNAIEFSNNGGEFIVSGKQTNVLFFCCCVYLHTALSCPEILNQRPRVSIQTSYTLSERHGLWVWKCLFNAYELNSEICWCLLKSMQNSKAMIIC